MRRLGVAVLAAASVLGARPSLAQPQIDHDPIGCVVAGRFPKVDACFPGVDVARARVYFQKLGGPHWYWVDFKPADACFSAVLPKPTKSIEKMAYYVEIADRGFREARTDDRTVDVVPDAGGCKKDVPVAGWVPNAVVTVGAPVGAAPLPAGFVGASVIGGGIGTGAIVGGVAAASAATVGTAAVLSNNTQSATAAPTAAPTSAATATPTPAATSAPTATPTPPTPAPTTPPAPFQASVRVSPTGGVEPLQVTFDACASTGQNLQFGYDYDGDGIEDQRGPCRVTRTYTLSGVTFASPRAAAASAAAGRDYLARITVWERVGNGETYSETVLIHVDPVAPTPAPCDGVGPSVTMTKPVTPPALSGTSAPLEASASDVNEVQSVQFKAQNCSDGCFGPVEDVGTPSPVPGPGTTFSATWSLPACESGPWDVWAVATDTCGASTTSARTTVDLDTSSLCPAFSSQAAAADLTWRAELSVPNGTGLLAVNGTPAAVSAGSSTGRAALAKSAGNRVEFTLQKGDRGGLLTLQRRDAPAWDRATLRVLAGELVSIAGDTLVFRLKGLPGERLAFSFD